MRASQKGVAARTRGHDILHLIEKEQIDEDRHTGDIKTYSMSTWW
jgi:hypothetical protein